MDFCSQILEPDSENSVWTLITREIVGYAVLLPKSGFPKLGPGAPQVHVVVVALGLHS